ncbi:MAG: hypothetical protein QOK89_03500 [Nitrososphaeraceae archaeon]|nr:hypothetical protein [Nitrososphaeraceae archaeon]
MKNRLSCQHIRSVFIQKLVPELVTDFLSKRSMAKITLIKITIQIRMGGPVV